MKTKKAKQAELTKKVEFIIQQSRLAYPNLPDEIALSEIRFTSLDNDAATIREAVTRDLSKQLRKKDYQLIRFLLEQEALYSEACWCVSYHVNTLAAMLAHFGKVEDIQFLWELKNHTFDLQPTISSNYFFGAGIEETLAYLKQDTSSESAKILEYLSGQIENFSDTIEAFQKKNKERFGTLGQ